MPAHSSTFTVLRQRTFRNMWIGSQISNFGSLVQFVGAAWMMTSLTTSQSKIALVQSSVALPVMIGSLAAGVLADNFDRRRLMIVAQSFMLVVSLVLMVFAFEDLLTPWSLLAFTFLIGCGMALHNPSWMTSLGDFVPHEQLPAAVSMNSMGMNLTRSVAPAAGGAIVAVAGAAAAFAVNAVSYLGIIVALLAWKPEFQPKRLPPERFGSAAAAGLRYLAMSPNLLRAMLRGFVFGLAAIILQALLPIIAKHQLSGGAFMFGALLGAFGLGAVGGALATSPLRARLNNESICRLGFLLFAGCCVILAISKILVVTLAATFLAGACWLSLLSLINVTIQLSTPRWVLGRMLALHMTSVFGGMAIGGWVWGMVADRYSLTAALLISAIILVLGALWGLRAPLPDTGELNLSPVGDFVEPTSQLDLTHKSGPIVITIEYTIAQEDVPQFLEAMTQRRRVRIRNGAHNWTLLRNLEQPETWTESCLFPTWIDYIRHHDRRTLAESENTERLHALHRGPQPPLIRRLIERQTVSRVDNVRQIEPATTA